MLPQDNLFFMSLWSHSALVRASTRYIYMYTTVQKRIYIYLKLIVAKININIMF